MEFYHISYYLLLSFAAFGAFFVPSVRALCACVLTFNLLAYGIAYFFGDIFGANRIGFVLALTDVSIGTAIASIFRNSIPAKLIASTFAIYAFVNMSMTLAVIEKTPTFIYTNYELLIAIISLIQAALLFGNKYRDAYRYIFNNNNNNKNSVGYLGRDAVNKDVS